MALLADRVAQGWLQIAGVDDRIVRAGIFLLVLMTAQVQFTGTVTALATDRFAAKLAVSVESAFHQIGPVGMTEQTILGDQPLEVHESVPVARRYVPTPGAGVPANRRFKEEPVVIDQ